MGRGRSRKGDSSSFFQSDHELDSFSETLRSQARHAGMNTHPGVSNKSKVVKRREKNKFPPITFGSAYSETPGDLVSVNYDPPRGTSSRQRYPDCSPSPLITGPDTSLGSCVAIDCEMVGTGLRGSVSMLGRCSVVNHHGNVLYDTYVAPLAPVTDYRTPWSGIRKHNLLRAPSFDDVQSRVKNFMQGRTLVGHDIRHDLKVLDLVHPLKNIRDTCRYTFNPFTKNNKGKLSKLKTQLKCTKNLDIQRGEHSSVEDAQAAMALYQSAKVAWEASIDSLPL